MSSVWKTERETLENDHNSSTSIGCFKKKRRNFKGPKTAFDKNQLQLVLPLFSPRSFLFMGNGGGGGRRGWDVLFFSNWEEFVLLFAIEAVVETGEMAKSAANSVAECRPSRSYRLPKK